MGLLLVFGCSPAAPAGEPGSQDASTNAGGGTVLDAGVSADAATPPGMQPLPDSGVSFDAGVTQDAGVDPGIAPDAGKATLPGSIDGVEPEAHAHHPPMMDSKGTLYRLTESIKSDGNRPRMMRSANRGETWSEADAKNRPSAVDLEGCWQLQHGTSIYVSVANSNKVWFSVFNTSDAPEKPDQWVVTERLVDDLNNGSGVAQFSSLARTSDGQFWLFYSDTLVSGRQQIAYRRRSVNGTWSSPQKIGETSGSFTGPRAIVGKGDVTHVFYNDLLNHQLLTVRLSPSGQRSTPTRVDAGGTSKERLPHTTAVVIESGGNELMVVGYADAKGAFKSVTLRDGVPEVPDTITSQEVLQNPSVALNDGMVAHLSTDGRTVYALWVDKGSGDVLRSSRGAGATWSAPVTVWNSGAGTAWWLYSNVYRRGGRKVLGFTYDQGPHVDDVGNIKYDEVDLGP